MSSSEVADAPMTLPADEGVWSRTLHPAPGSGSFDVFKSPSEAFEVDMATRDAYDLALRNESEKITDSEAAWVIAHLSREGGLTSAERRLLAFLGEGAPAIAPSLRAVIERTSVAVPKVGRP